MARVVIEACVARDAKRIPRGARQLIGMNDENERELFDALRLFVTHNICRLGYKTVYEVLHDSIWLNNQRGLRTIYESHGVSRKSLFLYESILTFRHPYIEKQNETQLHGIAQTRRR